MTNLQSLKEQDWEEEFMEKQAAVFSVVGYTIRPGWADAWIEILDFIREKKAKWEKAARQKGDGEGYYKGRMACIEQIHGTKREPVRALVDEKLQEARTTLLKEIREVVEGMKEYCESKKPGDEPETRIAQVAFREALTDVLAELEALEAKS